MTGPAYREPLIIRITLGLLLATLALSLIGFITTELAEAGASEKPEPAKLMRWMHTPCPTEDSINCYWDAAEQGDGAGRSFYAIRIGDKVCIRYWRAKANRRHGYCTRP